MHWSIFAIFAAIIIAISFFLRKQILQKHSIYNLLFYLYFGILISGFIMLMIIKDKNKDGFKKFDTKTKGLAILSGAILPFAIYCISRSLITVKNPAYTGITFAVFKTLILLLLSIYLLNSPYNKMTLLGVAFALTGVVLIILNE